MLDLISGINQDFLHIDEVKAAWKFVDPIIDYWTKNKVKASSIQLWKFRPRSIRIIFEDPSQFWR